MKYIFETENIDKKTYRRAIAYYLLVTGRDKLWRRMKDWTIVFRPSTLSHLDPFFYGKQGVGGHTDGVSKRIVVYVNDKSEDFSDIFYPYIRANMIPISHELSHAVLIEYGFSFRVPLRHDDLGGNKAGTVLPFYVAEVHDRDIENRFINYQLNWFNWKKLKSIKLQLRGLDITDLRT